MFKSVDLHPLSWCMAIKLYSQVQIYQSQTQHHQCQRSDRTETDREELIVVFLCLVMLNSVRAAADHFFTYKEL